MDGYEAARRIRELEIQWGAEVGLVEAVEGRENFNSSTRKKLPIVAVSHYSDFLELWILSLLSPPMVSQLTADVLKGTREKCTMAGMDG